MITGSRRRWADEIGLPSWEALMLFVEPQGHRGCTFIRSPGPSGLRKEVQCEGSFVKTPQKRLLNASSMFVGKPGYMQERRTKSAL